MSIGIKGICLRHLFFSMVGVGTIKNWIKGISRVVGCGKDPDFLIIGAQKCGTTTLHYLLDQHPKLYGSFPKEVNYFSTFFNYPERDLNWYRSHFTDFGGAELCYESTPNYLYVKEAPKRIWKQYPDIKLIALLRDPVARAFSAWNMYHDYYIRGIGKQRLRHGPVPGSPNTLYQFFFANRTEFPSFSETIEAELSSIQHERQDGPNLLRKGLYHEQLLRYYNYFREDQLLILDFDDLADRPFDVCDRVLGFIGTPDQRWKPKIKAKNRRRYNTAMTDAEKNILRDFYQEPNRRLAAMLPFQPAWLNEETANDRQDL